MEILQSCAKPLIFWYNAINIGQMVFNTKERNNELCQNQICRTWISNYIPPYYVCEVILIHSHKPYFWQRGATYSILVEILIYHFTISALYIYIFNLNSWLHTTFLAYTWLPVLLFCIMKMTWHCHRPFNDCQCCFQMKAVLPFILTHCPLGDAVVILKSVIFKIISGIDVLSIFCEIALRWVPQDLTVDQSALVMLMAWCRNMVSLGHNELRQWQGCFH